MRRINKKGGMMDLLILMAVAFAAVLFFAGWIFANNLLADTILAIDNPSINITDAANKTIVPATNALAGLKWVAAAIIFGSMLGIMVSNFLVKAHPVFLVPYVLFTILSIVLSAYIANAYEDILSGGVLAATLQDFSFANFFFLNLPIWITIIGVAGGIMLFIGISSDREIGGSII